MTVSSSATFEGPDTLTNIQTLDFSNGVYNVQDQTFSPSCFATGTRLLTGRGEVPVEALRVAEPMPALLRGRLARIRWIGHREIDMRGHPRPWDVQPVRVHAHAFGADRPRRDLRLSSRSCRARGQGVLIPIRYLLNGATIVQEQADSVAAIGTSNSTATTCYWPRAWRWKATWSTNGGWDRRPSTDGRRHGPRAVMGSSGDRCPLLAGGACLALDGSGGFGHKPALHPRITTMSRRCQITGKGVLSGNNVSHANNRTRRRFLPNLQETSLLSDLLGTDVKLRMSTRAIRTVERSGGIDAFLLATPNRRLPEPALALKRRLRKARGKRDAAGAPA